MVLSADTKKSLEEGVSVNETSEKGLAPIHYVHELPQADEERLEKLFNNLDRDGNGRIDIADLSAALKDVGLSHKYAETFLRQSDRNSSGDAGLAEFVYYVREHEKNLKLQFSHLDKNQDGKVDLEELISAFKDLGIEMDKTEAKRLLLRMDQDGSLNISYDEWRDFLLLAPSTDIHGLNFGGILLDIFSALTSGNCCVAVKELLVNYVRKNHSDVEVFVGLEARGFLFSLLLAAEFGFACVPIRKKGKLPGECYSHEYVLEYGCDTFEMQKGSIRPGQKVIVIDDLLATGGTLQAAQELLKMANVDLVECMVLIELSDLKGREKIHNTKVHSFIQY